MHIPPPPVVGWFRDAATHTVAFGTKGGGELIISRLSGDRGGDLPDPSVAANQMTGGRVEELVTHAGRVVNYAFGETPAAPGVPPRRRAFGSFREAGALYYVQLALPPAEYDPTEVRALLRSIEPTKL